MARRSLAPRNPVARYPKRTLGVEVTEDGFSRTIDNDWDGNSRYSSSAGGTDPETPGGLFVFWQYTRQERDQIADDLGELDDEWVPVGEITALSLEVKNVTELREDKAVNAIRWMSEFEADCEFTLGDLLINTEDERFTVQSVQPVISGGIVTRRRVMLDQRDYT